MSKVISNTLSFKTTPERLAISEKEGEIYLCTKYEVCSEIKFLSCCRLTDLCIRGDAEKKKTLQEILDSDVSNVLLVDSITPTEQEDGIVIVKVKTTYEDITLNVLYNIQKVGLDNHKGINPYLISF